MGHKGLPDPSTLNKFSYSKERRDPVPKRDEKPI